MGEAPCSEITLSPEYHTSGTSSIGAGSSGAMPTPTPTPSQPRKLQEPFCLQEE